MNSSYHCCLEFKHTSHTYLFCLKKSSNCSKLLVEAFHGLVNLVPCDRMCVPKKVGSLNIIDVEAWNKIAIGKLLWNLAQKTVWVKWVHIYYVKK